ncbi:MAG: hypothetical protein KGL93_01760, partial [Gemmatimonadota bacterium]|nr:hypothetical protein [Gemmatimonadota bacterium]
YVAFGIVRAATLGLLDRRGATPAIAAERAMPSRSRDASRREDVGDEPWPDARPRRRRRGRRGEVPAPDAPPPAGPRSPNPSPESTAE